jgi:hypothetical protein
MTTDDEWAAIALLLSTFAQSNARPYDADADQAYRILLGEYPAEAVLLAIKRLVNEGQTFLPTPGEIVGRIPGAGASADPTVPTGREIIAAMNEMWGGARRLMREADEPLTETAAVYLWLADRCHPWAAAFVAECGLDTVRMLPLNDPEYGALEQHRLAQRWDEWLGRARERQAAGLPVGVSEVRRQLGPRQFDPLAALGVKPDVAGELTRGEEQP